MLFYFLLALLDVRSELIGVFEVCRHGARSPIEKFSWDKVFWAEGYGELTTEGMMQQYIIGQEFRNRYISKAKFVNSRFSLSEIYVRSTDYHRTIMSAQAQLLGLFPNGPSITESMRTKAVPPFPISNISEILAPLGNSALPNNIQPVPIDIYSVEQDNTLLGFYKSCPRMKDIMALIQQSGDYKGKVDDYKANLQIQLKELYNKDISFEDAGWFADAINTNLYYGYQLPEGIDEKMMEKLLEIAIYSNSYFFEGDGVRLACSEFYKEMLKVFEGLKKGTSTRKWSIYMAHDTTLIGFLIAIGAWDKKGPEFASSLVFELHVTGDRSYVKAIYNDVVVKIGSCSEECPYNEFVKSIAAWVIPNIHDACETEHRKFHEVNTNPFLEKQT